MQQWEYMRVLVRYDWSRRGSHPNEEPFDMINYATSNDKIVMKKSNLSNFFDYLNKLGREGWEMINGNSTGDIGVVETYFFRRPIE